MNPLQNHNASVTEQQAHTPTTANGIDAKPDTIAVGRVFSTKSDASRSGVDPSKQAFLSLPIGDVDSDAHDARNSAPLSAADSFVKSESSWQRSSRSLSHSPRPRPFASSTSGPRVSEVNAARSFLDERLQDVLQGRNTKLHCSA